MDNNYMHPLPTSTAKVITFLQERDIEPILYGSQGISLYIGAFKQFGDIDLLIDSSWLNEDWKKLVQIMKNFKFELQNKHEHEFVNSESVCVGFASKNILIRDGITQTLQDVTTIVNVNGIQVQTLKPEAFKKVYEFSEKDGYRKDVRGKKDREVIALINSYMSQGS